MSYNLCIMYIHIHNYIYIYTYVWVSYIYMDSLCIGSLYVHIHTLVLAIYVFFTTFRSGMPQNLPVCKADQIPRLKRQCGLSLNVAWDYHGVICVMAIIVVNGG